jgi:uncharacterized coiled-coil protein SlyX
MTIDELNAALAAHPDATDKTKLLLTKTIDDLGDQIDEMSERGEDTTEAKAKLASLEAWAAAIDADSGRLTLNPGDQQTLLDKITTLDVAAAKSAALNALLLAVDGLVKSYQPPAKAGRN